MRTPPITVREAVPEEYDVIGHLMVESYEQYATAIPPEIWVRYKAELRDIAGRARRAAILVAEEAGVIVGAVALLNPYQDPRRHWPDGWAAARGLAVSPRHRRKGVARALMDECVRRARASGAPAIALNTASYMPAAVSLYKTLRFTRLPAHEISGRSGVVVMAYGMELVPGGLTP